MCEELNWLLLALKTQAGAMSQGVQAASRISTGWEKILSWKFQKEHLDF